MADPILTEEERKELRAFILDIQTNPFSAREIQAMGGVRSVLSDAVLVKLGFELEGARPFIQVAR